MKQLGITAATDMKDLSMNIAIINISDRSGGASRAAARLKMGLKIQNQRPAMTVWEKRSDAPDVFGIEIVGDTGYFLERHIEKIKRNAIYRNRAPVSDTFFSLPYPGYDLSSTSVLRDADIINLHWVAKFQSVETIGKLLELGKPVVWTLHDENPFTGGCHYTAGCRNFETTCYPCFQLRQDPFRLPASVLENKIATWGRYSNLTIVTPSRWLADQAMASRIFGPFRVEVIANGIETEIFRPFGREECRRSLKIQPHATTLLFGAHNLREKRKGFRQLLAALDFCSRDTKFADLISRGQVQILTFGYPSRELQALNIPLYSMGFVDDDNMMARIYAAADLLVLPSLEDNLPNNILEAMACGTPVAAFSVGGIPDLITRGETGYLARPSDPETLGKTILHHFLEVSAAQRQEMRQKCRRRIESRCSLEKQAGAYKELFLELLEGKQNNSLAAVSRWSLPPSGTLQLAGPDSAISPRFKELFDAYRIWEPKGRLWRKLLPSLDNRLRPILLKWLRAVKLVD